MTKYDGPERREGLPFSENEKRQIQAMIDCAVDKVMKDYPAEHIAELAAKRATEKLTNNFYMSIGKSVFQKALFVVGVSLAALYIWLSKKGLV
jgi:hypothetical protein